MVDAEQAEVVPDHLEHRGDSAAAEQGEPAIFGLSRIGRRTPRRARSHRDQVVTGIEAFGDLADIFAERLAVTHVQRAGEYVDLRAGIVDVIFPGHPVPGGLEQPRQRIADHRAAAMAHVHRARSGSPNISTLTRSFLPMSERPYFSPSA